MGLERILLVRKNLGIRPEAKPRAGYFVISLGDDAAWFEAVKLSAELRRRGEVASVDYRRRSMKAQLRFADAEGFASAIILGEDEIKSGNVSVKDLVTGEQTLISRAQLLPG